MGKWRQGRLALWKYSFAARWTGVLSQLIRQAGSNCSASFNNLTNIDQPFEEPTSYSDRKLFAGSASAIAIMAATTKIHQAMSTRYAN